ncbi:ATP synthase F1, gamma subunit [Treponema primitia ZAS-2]|uniref:ATP synthase gamma chain n=1 Tax=Treponema primitia (strain ATCC BAA-887 / DSM 12427 / ZAS-2) TaxID=545694 RepID=F5YRJ3_TREPZ|nr:ATP synthase F1 subunit gamma [Treponema primitia]AEF83719.1 ATP synthase F1, gamma subunit [Treponema primitia ZAS-2]
MANLRDVRLRMRAIQQTLQVTKAMDLISTAKLRKGRRVLEDTEPYFTRIQKSMFDIVSGAGYVHSDFFGRKTDADNYHTAVVVITSDKGLAGGYNANIFRYVNELCAGVKNPILVLIGAIGYRHFMHSPYLILENFSFKSKLPDVDDAKEIADYIISQYLWGMFDEVHIVYTHMYSTIKLLPTAKYILPLKTETMRQELDKIDTKEREFHSFEYIPSAEEVFDALVPLYIKGLVYGCLVEAYASEQSARIAAMDEASKNAEEMLGTLRLHYNRVRQAGITQEMTEIVSGSSALSK